MTATRRLAAILAVDVVGYSRLMARTKRGRRARLGLPSDDPIARHVRYTVDSALSTVSSPPHKRRSRSTDAVRPIAAN